MQNVKPKTTCPTCGTYMPEYDIVKRDHQFDVLDRLEKVWGPAIPTIGGVK